MTLSGRAISLASQGLFAVSLFIASVTHLAAQAIDELDAERLQVQNYRTVCVYFDEIIQKDNQTPFSTASSRNRVEVRLGAAGPRILRADGSNT